MNCLKTKYPNEHAANNVISKAWSGQATWRGKTLPMRAYKCACNSWHLTSKPLMSREELIQRSQSRGLSMA